MHAEHCLDEIIDATRHHCFDICDADLQIETEAHSITGQLEQAETNLFIRGIIGFASHDDYVTAADIDAKRRRRCRIDLESHVAGQSEHFRLPDEIKVVA